MALEPPGSAARAVLVTRPDGEAARDLCDKLRARGYAVAHQPLLELHALQEFSPQQRQHVRDLHRYQHVIFISANAVRFGMACLQDDWPQWPADVNWYAIGSATAALLATYGVCAVTPGSAMTSEGLLAVPELAQVDGHRVLIVKGQGGRGKLASELTARGATVETLACYRRALPDVSSDAFLRLLTDTAVGTILITSGEGLAFLAQLLSPQETSKLGLLNIVVPSVRVAKQARDAGFEQVITAENASDAAMLQSLDECQYSSGEHE